MAEVLWGMRGLQPDSIALHLYTDPLLLLHCITWQISAPPYNAYIAAFKIKTSSAMIQKTQVHRHCNAQLALLQGVHRCPGAAMHPAGISSLLNVTSHLVSPVSPNISPRPTSNPVKMQSDVFHFCTTTLSCLCDQMLLLIMDG